MTKGKRKKKRSSLPHAREPENFFNRELSWLNFNSRVLHQAEDPYTPLIEKFRFLSIYFSNLDEFVMKRVGGIKRYKESDYSFLSVDGLDSETQLLCIRNQVLKDNARAEELYLSLAKELGVNGAELLDWSGLSSEEKAFCDHYFLENYFPILTPLSVDPGKHFPFISNLSFSFGVLLESPEGGESIFSRVKIPELAQAWIELPGSEPGRKRLIRGSDIIRENLEHLYRGIRILDVAPFRVTRNADWDHDEEDAEDLLVAVEESINERRLQEVIRLETLENTGEQMLAYLMDKLEIEKDDLYIFNSFMEYASLNSLGNIDLPKLKYPVYRAPTPFWSQGEELFERLRERDRLAHPPYESFAGTVEKFIVHAANDPSVLSLKMTLYRTGEDSPFIQALIDAAENGKQVVCLIELRARFDERRNIYWARKMEQAGVHVVYGVLGLKTHSKLALVTRKEGNRLSQYAHIATGNYNSKTSKIYTDIGLLTSEEGLTREVSEVFNYLTGTSLKEDYQELLVAPINAKPRFFEKIRNEAKNAKAGKVARIIAKMNSLEDVEIINELYLASQCGVQIDLIIRGLCCLRPGVAGMSENIRVFSVIGRFLEHSRVFVFANGQEQLESGEVFIGSADWMRRNLHRRVEVITPIKDILLKKDLVEFLNISLQDESSCWELGSSGDYQLRSGDVKTRTHEVMMKRFLALGKASD